MARSRIFTPEVERSIAARVAAGESTHSIAKSLGTSPQNVQNSAKRSRSEPSAAKAGATGGPVEQDEFEAKQIAALKRIEREMKAKRTKAVGLATLVKAQNDTIKAIRQFRLVKPPVDSAKEASAERVLAKLQRLASRSSTVETALAEIESPSEDTGTDDP